MYGSSYEDYLTVYTDEPGYSETGYVQPRQNVNGSYLDMTVDWDQSENVELVFYYFTRSETHRVFALVNGHMLRDPVIFNPQTEPGTWNTAHIIAPLNAGENVIRLVSGTVTGLPNIDKLEIYETSESPSFPDPAPVEQPGTLWCEPSTIQTGPGTFTHEVYLNTGTQSVGNCRIFMIYDKGMVTVIDTTNEAENLNLNGAGFLFGCYRMTSHVSDSVTPGTGLHILTLTWEALAPGTTEINFYVEALEDETGNIIGEPGGYGIEIIISE